MGIAAAAAILSKLQPMIGTGQYIPMQFPKMHGRKAMWTYIAQGDRRSVLLSEENHFLVQQRPSESPSGHFLGPCRAIPGVSQEPHLIFPYIFSLLQG